MNGQTQAKSDKTCGGLATFCCGGGGGECGEETSWMGNFGWQAELNSTLFLDYTLFSIVISSCYVAIALLGQEGLNPFPLFSLFFARGIHHFIGMILDFVNGHHIDISPDREAFMLLFVSFDFIISYLLSQASRDIISKWWQVASHLCLLEEQWRGVARLQRWNPDKERYRLQERIHYQGGRIVDPRAGARCSGISVWFQSGLHWNPVKPQSVEPYSTGWKDQRFVQIVQARLGRRRWRI